MTNELATTQQQSALAQFGGRDEIRELAQRIKLMMSGGGIKLTDGEALATAQVALLYDLSPFNGEVWPMKGSDGVWRGVCIGIKGTRKHAHRQAIEENGIYWTEMVKVDPATYKAAPDAIVYECRLRDTVTMQAYGKSLNILTTAGVPYTEAMKMIGPAPVVLGVGIVNQGEKSKMPFDQLSRKRAESAALKQRYDMQFRGAGRVLVDDGMEETEDSAPLTGVIEGEINEEPKRPQPLDPQERAAREAEIQASLGF